MKPSTSDSNQLLTVWSYFWLTFSGGLFFKTWTIEEKQLLPYKNGVQRLIPNLPDRSIHPTTPVAWGCLLRSESSQWDTYTTNKAFSTTEVGGVFLGFFSGSTSQRNVNVPWIKQARFSCTDLTLHVFFVGGQFASKNDSWNTKLPNRSFNLRHKNFTQNLSPRPSFLYIYLRSCFIGFPGFNEESHWGCIPLPWIVESEGAIRYGGTKSERNNT